MSTTEAHHKFDMHLEVDIIPVSDVERSKQFYERLGWRFDDDVAPGTPFASSSWPRSLASASSLFAETLRAWVGQLKDGPLSLVGVRISW
jgi:catechol 2,3-dioxygenase-like lactoylglutathione lyase family enzyme